jgi:hypothetical protein
MRTDTPFGISDEALNARIARQSVIDVDNHPLRDAAASFFDALMSDDADFIRNNIVTLDDFAATVGEAAHS